MKVLILAAGASSRTAPDDKLSLDINGLSMLNHVVHTYQSAQIGEIHVVIGGAHAKTRQSLLKEATVQTHHFKNAHLGMGASLAFGIHELAGDEPIMVVLADMPDIQIETIKAIAYVHKRGHITAPSFKGQLGHPIIFDPKFFDELKSLTGDQGGKLIIQKYAHNLKRVETADLGIVKDYDNPKA